MCLIYPFHFVIMYIFILCPVWLISCAIASQIPKLGVQYDAENYTIHMEGFKEVSFSLDEVDRLVGNDYTLQLYSDNSDLADVSIKEIPIKTDEVGRYFNGSFNLSGIFLGQTYVHMNLSNKNESIEIGKIPVTVIRKPRIIDHIFTGSVAVLVSIIYINFGCALDWSYLIGTLKKPIGPSIGFFGQFVIMPLLSFGLGKLLFPGSIEMQLGMLFTGVSPGGGASNIWVYVLGGNLSLSIAMTTISTFAAFAMMPLWIFTLGRVIFKSGNLIVPYAKIGTFAVALVIPLGIGYIIQKKAPKLSRMFVRILKPFSVLLILFIIIFAIVTNLFMFKLFSWRIIIAGLGLPWLGYMLGFLAAVALRQTKSDCLTIAIETGIQNTGIAIFLLRFTLSQPAADLTTVIPVSVAMMTPFPLLICYIVQKIRARCQPSHEKFIPSEPDQLPAVNTVLYVENGKTHGSIPT